ncbi:hypothetical protein [Candidatus Phaeomarinobacter ectocarpi]|uniref:hypothetical protein n=1 Tax=Candidatus Phaeomarinibacter ectocarpi TaxID=1458461 RepID=UPI0005C77F2B|nr:hypothetical protein [Candidatus Phaeomarinobacter ectocarpi]
MQDDWIERWLPTILLVSAGVIFAFLFAELLREFPMLVDFVRDFQTLITGFIAIGGVWWSLQFQKSREEDLTRRSMVTSVHFDVQTCVGDANIKIQHATRAYTNLRQVALRPRRQALEEMAKPNPISNIRYWLPQIGRLPNHAHDILVFVFLYETVESRLVNALLDERKSDEDILLLIAEKLSLLSERGAMLEEMLRAEFPNETVELMVPA